MDSDEEEDSQNPENLDLATSSQLLLNGDDTVRGPSLALHDDERDIGDESEQSGLEEEKDGEFLSVEGEAQASSTTLPGAAVKERNSHVKFLPAKYGRQTLEKLLVQDFGDLDELQEDHYRGTPTAQLQAELLRGAHELDSPAEFGSASQHREDHAPLLALSSLSSISGEDDGKSVESGMAPPGHGEDLSIDGFYTSNSDPRANGLPLPESSRSHSNAEAVKGTRTLRHRKAIQLHPYQIESEKYRQVLKARGVKPLRIAQMEAQAANALREESQNVEYQAEESQLDGRENDQDNSNSSPPPLSQNSSVEQADNPRDVFVFGEDDLPEINDFLRNPTQKYTKLGNKRLKTGLPTFRMPPGIRRRAHISPQRDMTTTINDNDEPRRDTVIRFDDDDEVMFDVPPSPPNSGNETPLGTNGAILPPPRSIGKSSQGALPTPITSSEPRRQPMYELSEDELSEASARNQDDESRSDGSSNDQPSHRLHRVQRRMRGVLPASWLKLDIKNKKPDTTRKNHPSASPDRDIVQRGVARPVTTASKRTPDLPNPRINSFLLSEDEDSSSDRENQRALSPQRQRIDIDKYDDRGLTGDRRGEAAEDDQIDAMLPPATRSRHGIPRQKKKHQSKLSDFKSNTRREGGDLAKKSRSSHTHQRRIMDGFDKGHRRKPRFRPPKLSILDAPTIETSPHAKVPAFLKIATRAARSRNDKGRHSPSRKYLRLATRDDDQDANETLHNWREGTIVPQAIKKHNAQPSRHPLYPRSGNNTLPPQAHSDRNMKNGPGTSSPRKTFKKSKASLTGPQRIQSSLDHLVQRRTRETPERPTMAALQQMQTGSRQRRQFVSSIRPRNDSRPAMLEIPRDIGRDLHAQTLFHRDLSRINQFDDDSGLPNVLRFFDEDRRARPESAHAQQDPTVAPSRAHESDIAIRKPVAPRRRKRRPQRVDLSVAWSRPSSTPIMIDDSPVSIHLGDTTEHAKQDLITGLGPFGTRYSDNFNVIPLPTGICFHASTFIGSGAFARSLRLEGLSDLDKTRGHAIFAHEGQTYRWGPWNDSVSSELGGIIAWISQGIQGQYAETQKTSNKYFCDQALSLLTSIIAYFSDHITFLDPVDRTSCVQKCKGLMSTNLFEPDEHSSLAKSNHESNIHFCILILVFANQVRQISRHELVPFRVQDEIRSLVYRAAQQNMNIAFRKKETSQELELQHCHLDSAGYITGGHQSMIHAFVVTHHVLNQVSGKTNEVWHMMSWNIPTKGLRSCLDVVFMESSWKRLFSLLPLLEFDTQGVLEVGRRFKLPFDNWMFVKKLLTPVLEACIRNSRGQASSFNSYCRALFGRCLHLINGWGWRCCDSIIGTLFDFFARKSLAHLSHEESHRSPLFLEHLVERPSLNAEPEDRCFHILLKIIGSGIEHMRSFYPEKKIRDMVWRLMPNHGRSHPKEEAIHQQDLDALRNHHDLICTLYWASPPSCRPKLSVIRDLVHVESSHREACHISIRAWSNLVKYQLSTDEPLDALKPFAEWYEDLLSQITRQHGLARTEAEDQVRSVQHVGGIAISKQQLESTIAKNQRQVEAVLSDALVSLQLAIDSARDCEGASLLMPQAMISVFDLFDAGRPHATKPVIQALEVLSAFASKCLDHRQLRTSIENDDSQDYGDWSVFDGDNNAPVIQSDTAAESPMQQYQEPLRHLLSNAFGSDFVPDDAFLRTIIEVWVKVAQVLVRDGNKSWTDYVDRFSNDSWTTLRDTEQTRKYTAYYLAALIEKENKLYHDHETFFLTLWIGLLVERESLLKFQQRLTEALLNTDCGHPILKNLPFCVNAATGSFEITAAEFSNRRLSLISTMLSNMRASLEEAVFDPAVNAMQRRQEYKDLLKHMMGTMKHNYQELGHGSHVQGAYVDFVHRIVELLQQHTSTICPVDRFFTDNGAFPLPATDPTYVVGQLKNYALRLQDSKTPKQLAVFLQSISERAAADGQQQYLVGQLYTSMSNAFEDGVSTRPTLRAFIVKAVVPAYIEMACTASGSRCGWILAMPYLQALQKCFQELLLDLDGANANSISAMTSIITAFLDSVRRPFGSLLSSDNLLEEPGILKLVSACYSSIIALLPTLDYLVRLSGPAQRAVNDLEFLKGFGIYLSSLLHGHQEPHGLEIDDDVANTSFAETRNFATQELKEILTKNWTYNPRDQLYYVTRGASRREVVVDIGLYEEEKGALLEALDGFWKCLARMPALCDEDDDARGFVVRWGGGYGDDSTLVF